MSGYRTMEDTDLPLNLSQPSATQTVFNGGISIDNLTWWFWVKIPCAWIRVRW